MARAANKAAAFATRLRELRAQRGLQSGEVARALGMNATTLSRLEHGRQNPSIDTAHRLAEFYGVTLDTLLKV